jgi:hypothetical protein
VPDPGGIDDVKDLAIGRRQRTAKEVAVGAPNDLGARSDPERDVEAPCRVAFPEVEGPCAGCRIVEERSLHSHCVTHVLNMDEDAPLWTLTSGVASSGSGSPQSIRTTVGISPSSAGGSGWDDLGRNADHANAPAAANTASATNATRARLPGELGGIGSRCRALAQ